MQRYQNDAKNIAMTDDDTESSKIIKRQERVIESLSGENQMLKNRIQLLENQMKQLLERAGITSSESVTSAGSTPPVSSLPSLFNKPEERLAIALLKACKQGDEKAVESLLEQKANPDTPVKGELSYYAAVYGGNAEVLRLLLSKGEKSELLDWDKCTAHNLRYGNIFNMPDMSKATINDLEKIDSPCIQNLLMFHGFGDVIDWKQFIDIARKYPADYLPLVQKNVPKGFENRKKLLKEMVDEAAFSLQNKQKR